MAHSERGAAARPRVVLRIGPAAAEKSAEVLEGELVPLVRAGRGGEALYLVRGELRRRRLRAAALRACGGAAFDLPVTTLDRHVEARVRASPGGRRLLSRAERRVLLGESLPPGTWPGLVERLGRLVGELARAGASPEALERALLETSPIGLRDRELLLAASRYRAALRERALLDPEEALAAVTGLSEKPLRLLVIDGLLDLPALSRRYVEKLVRTAARAVILVDDEVDDAEHVSPAIAPLVAFYRSLGAAIEVRAAPARVPGEIVARRLVRGALSGDPLPAGEALSLFRAGTAAAEVAEVATRIRAIAAREPDIARDLSQVAVAFPRFDRAAVLVRELFPRAGVPFSLLEGERLACAAPVRALFELIAVVTSGFDRAQLARALLAPTTLFRAPGGRPLDGGRIDRIAREAGIAGPIGRKRFLESLDAHHAWLSREAAAAAASPRAARRRDQARRDAETLDRERAGLEAALAALADLAGDAQPAEHERRLLGLLDRFGITERLTRCTCAAEEEAALRAGAALSALATALAGVARALGDAPVPFERFVAALRVATAGERALPHARGERGRVVVLGGLELRGLRFAHVFLCGLTATALPGPPPRHVLIGERERGALGLEAPAGHVDGARCMLAGALGAAARSATLSYAADDEGGDADASPFLAELARLGVRVPVWTAAPETLRASAEEADLSRAVACARERLADAPPGPHGGRLSGRALEKLRAGLSARTSTRSHGVETAESAEGAEALSPSSTSSAAPVPPSSAEAPLLTLSPSELETYVSCPFRAFAERHLRLDALPEVEEEVGGREAGEIIHRILRRFYDGFPRGAGPGWVAEASSRMIEIARAELEREGADVFWLARVKLLLAGLDGGARKGTLRTFIEREGMLEPERFRTPDGAASRADQFAPRSLEAQLEVDLELPVDGRLARLRVRGIADRIDADADGRFIVYDYKTGRVLPDMAAVLEGLHFQLPVYLLGARRLFAGGPLGAAFYPVGEPSRMKPRWIAERGCVPSARASRGEVRGFAEALDRVPDAIGAALSGMMKGLYHPGHLPPRRKGCTYCEWKTICRVDHARAERVARSCGGEFFRPLPLVRDQRAGCETSAEMVKAACHG